MEKIIKIVEQNEKLSVDTFIDKAYQNYISVIFNKGNNEEIHRPDLPAMLYKLGNNISYYFVKDGKFHREDGPAKIEINLGSTYFAYCLDGKEYFIFKDFLKAQKDKIVYIKDEPHLIDGRKINKIDEKDYLSEVIKYLGIAN